MSSIINTAVINACKAAAGFNERVVTLRGMLSADVISDNVALVAALRPGVAKFYGIGFDASYGKSGKFVTDDESLSMAARTALSKLARAVTGPVVHEREAVKVRVAKVERDAYTAFLAACGGDAKRMAAVIKACKA